MKTSYISTTSLFLASAHAVAFKGPEPTPAGLHLATLAQGWTPKPSDPPQHIPAHLGDLRRRAGGSLIGYSAPDNTCGYVGGSLGAIRTCQVTETCELVTYSAGGGGVACCEAGVGCIFYDQCIDSAHYYTSSACDNACRVDTDIVKCTNSARPYCYGYSFAEWGASFYQCDSVKPTALDVIKTTFAGQTAQRSWSPVYYTPSSSGGSIISSEGIIPATRSTPALSTDSTPGDIVVPQTTSTGPGPTTTSAVPKPSSNAGAIAGGVVGGLAVIGAIVGGLIYICLRNKKKEKAAAAAGGAGVVGAGAAGAPAYTQNQMQQPQQPQMQQQQQYYDGNGQPIPVVGAYGVNDNKNMYDNRQSQYYGQQQQQQNPISPQQTYQSNMSPAPQYSPQNTGHSGVGPMGSPVPTQPTGVSQLDATETQVHGVPTVNKEGSRVYEVGS